MASLECHQPLLGQSISLAQGSLREAALVGKLIIRCDPGNAPVAQLLQGQGLVLPAETNTYNQSDKGEFFWLGPDEWLLRSELDPGSSQWRDCVSSLAKSAAAT